MHPKLVVRPDSGINGIADLRGKKVGTRGMHPGLNDWLLLKQRGLDVDRDDIELVNKVDGLESAEAAEQLEDRPESEAARHKKRAPLWQWVRDGKVDAALLLAPSHLFAADAGLKVIDIEPLPMIWYTTISSSLPFVEKHPDIVERFLKGLIEGIHFFKTQPEQSIEIIQRALRPRKASSTSAQATYDLPATSRRCSSRSSIRPWRRSRTSTRRPSARTRMPRSINPMELWDLHHIRHLDDSGFVDGLYGNRKGDAKADKNKHDPDYRREQERKQAEVIAAVKACGHLESENCDCH